MARMYSRKKGKSGSKKPKRTAPAEWVPYSKQEVELIALKLAKSGKTMSEIGLILRDNYGVPDIQLSTKKRLGTILKENKMSPKLPEDLLNLLKQSIDLQKHLECHKQDIHGKHSIELLKSKIRRIVEYYKKEKVLPSTWQYTPETAPFLIR